MSKEVVFEQLNKDEIELLLSAYDYDVDAEGFIISPLGDKIPSEEQPSRFLEIDNVALVSGSLKAIDGSPTSISKFIREEFEESDEYKS